MVIADVNGGLATSRLARALAHRLHRAGVAVASCDGARSEAEGTASVSAAVRRALRDGGTARPILVLFGPEKRQRRVVWGLALAGLLARVRLVVHATAARIPYEPCVADVFARADVVVTESEIGARAVGQCCEEASEPAPGVMVAPMAYPSPSSLPDPTPADRRSQRRVRLGVDDDALVVGCWGHDGWEQVAPLAMGIFAQFTRGHYWRCDDCGHLTPWSVDDHLRPVPREQCERCRSARGSVGRERDDTRLVLVGEPGDEDHAWGPRAIGEQLGLGDRIVHDSPGAADGLGQLWGCIDVHLQPHLLADVPAAIRASCALGIPVVATRYGAVEERLAGTARLVLARMIVDHSAGHRIALMDPGGALAELCHLAEDPVARRRTAAGLRGLAQAGETDAVLARWIELLDVAVAT